MDIATLVVDTGGTVDGMLLSALTAGFISALAHIVAGAVVGFAIGVTGVGGGSLMTPPPSPIWLCAGCRNRHRLALCRAHQNERRNRASQEKINRLGSGENTCSGQFTRSTDDALGPVWRLSG